LRKRQTWLLGVTAASIAAATALAGCSSGSSSSAGGPASTQASQAATPVPTGTPADSSKSPILIGLVLALTGTNSSDQGPPVLNVANAWVSWVNKTQGGIGGHPVKLLYENTQATPASAEAAAQELVSKGVVAAIGSADGQDEAIWSKPFVDAKIPVIGGAIISDQVLTSSPYVYGFSAGAVNGLKAQADVAKQQGAKKMATVLCNSAPTCAGASAVVGGEATKIGLSYAGYVGVSDGAPNYNAACLTLQQENVDYVYLGVAAEDVSRIVTDCAQQGYKPQYGDSFSSAEGAVLNPLTQQFGVTFSGFLPTFPWYGDTAAIKLYQQVMAEFSPTKQVFADQAPTATWTAFELFQSAMNASGTVPATVTSADIQSAMSKVSDEDLGGLLPQPLSWGAGKTSVDPSCGWAYKNVNGVFSGSSTPFCLGAES
jgi:branched-chain amino acid transport system substrate-binding protein